MVEENGVSHIETETGWWVPETYFCKQTLLPTTGSWQTVMDANGKILKAVMIYGRNGWWDSSYSPIHVSKWLKPKKWFHNSEDTIGRRDELEAYKKSCSGQGGPFRAI